MATEKDFRVKSSLIAPTSLQVGDAEITAHNSSIMLPPNSVISDGAGGALEIGSVDLTGYATESYVNTAVANVSVDLTGYATETYVNNTVANYLTISSFNTQISSYALTTDVNNALALKANTSSLAAVATSGNYNDLSNTPTIPSLSGYATETYVDNGLALKANTSSLSVVATSGSYNDLSNLPTLYTDSDTGAYLTANGYATQLWVTSQNYLTAESDTLDAITSRGNTTTNSITVANIATTGNVQIDGNLTVSGTQNIINTTDLAVEDNMIYLNDGSAVANPDLGIAGNYNDGTYAHAGIFRDATDGRWKFYDSYTPEPDASAFIDTTHGSFNLAPIEAGSIYSNGNLVVDTNTLYVDAATNRIGIGTSSPAYPLQVNFSGDSGVKAVSSDSHSSLYLDSGTNSGSSQYIRMTKQGVNTFWMQGNSSNNSLVFRPQATSTVANQVIIDSSGDVGIGTSSPSAKLEVIEGNTGAVSIKTDGHIQLNDTTSSTRAYTFLSRNAAYSMVGGNIRLDDSVTTGSHIGYSNGTNVRGGSGILFENTSAGSSHYGNTIFVQSNDTNDDTWVGRETMRITSAGNVGIGTSSPSYKLDVSGITRATSFLETVYAVTGTTPAIAATNGNVQTWTLSGNSTPTDSLNAGESITLMILDGSAYTITWTSLVDQWIGGSAPTLATTGYTVVELWKSSGTAFGAYVGDLS